jgi:hypothetical protein
MDERESMTQQEVSAKTLFISTVAASVIAVVVFVCFILPAEYNIDPTHIGHKLGLTELSHTHHHKDKPKAQKAIPISTKGPHSINLTIPAGKGIEYKFGLAKHEKMSYEWSTDGIALYFDLHGEPKGDTTGYFESYTIATSNEMKGSFTAPFSGSHGWYWKNTSEMPVVVTLTVDGQYKVIGIK